MKQIPPQHQYQKRARPELLKQWQSQGNISLIWRNLHQKHACFHQISCYSLLLLGQATLERMELNKQDFAQTKMPQEGQKANLQEKAHQQMQEYKLISQYLSLNPTPSSFLIQQSRQNQRQGESTESKGNETHVSSENAAVPKKQARKASGFHNFQKHLMTTLKRSIKIKRTANSDHSKTNVACQLWEYFLDHSKFSKRDLLCLLTGSIGKNEENHQSKNCQEYAKMLDYFSQYSQKEIRAAQKHLCKEVIRQSHKLIQCRSFENRRINKTEDFKNYYQTFISGLEEGKTVLRLPKYVKTAEENLNGEVQSKNSIS